MADYRIVRINRPVRSYDDRYRVNTGRGYCRNGDYPYVALRKTIFGWREIWFDEGLMLGDAYPEGSKRIVCSGDEATTEMFLKRYIEYTLGKPIKKVDVVAEFDYTGPTKIDRFLERIDYGRT